MPHAARIWSRVQRAVTFLAAVVGIAYAAHYFSIVARSKPPDLRFRYIIVGLTDVHHELSLEKRFAAVFGGAQVYVQKNLLALRMSQLLQDSDLVRGSVIEGRKYRTASSTRHDERFPASETLLLRHSLAKDPVAVSIARDNPNLRGLFSVTVAAERELCGGSPELSGFVEQVTMQPVSVMMLDIENVSPSPAHLQHLEMRYFRDSGSMQLYSSVLPSRDEPTSSETAPFTIEELTKGEHIVVPMALIFQTFRESNVMSFPLDRKPTKTSYAPSTGVSALKLYEWRFQDFSQHRLYMGPSYIVASVVVDRKEIPVRRLEDAQFTYADLAGAEYGSCPIVFSYSPPLREWIKQARVLVNAVGRSNERREFLKLGTFTGTVSIRELEAEITYLDYAAVHVTDRRGVSRVCMADDLRLAAVDGKYLELRPGSEVRISCSPKEPLAEATLEVMGYYDRLLVKAPRSDMRPQVAAASGRRRGSRARRPTAHPYVYSASDLIRWYLDISNVCAALGS